MTKELKTVQLKESTPLMKSREKVSILKPMNREVQDLASEASQGPADLSIKANTHHQLPQPAAIGIDGV